MTLPLDGDLDISQVASEMGIILTTTTDLIPAIRLERALYILGRVGQVMRLFRGLPISHQL